jgi:hypothetical protein
LQPQAPASAKPPLYKRAWFVAGMAVMGLALLSGMFAEGDTAPTMPVADTSNDDAAETAAAPVTDTDDSVAEAPDPPLNVYVSVPDVVGLNLRTAKAELEDAGHDVEVHLENVAGAKKGEVVGQTPGAGVTVREGAEVSVVVATGVEPVVVPDVVGMQSVKGRGVLLAEGFKVDVRKTETKSVPPGEIMKQSVRGEAERGDTVSLTVAKAPLTSGQENALRAAANYLDVMPFSRQGLINQLEFEDYTTADATFAVDHVSVDWNEQAVKAAKNYLDIMPFSRQGLIDQLVFEHYTYEQASYGVDRAM